MKSSEFHLSQQQHYTSRVSGGKFESLLRNITSNYRFHSYPLDPMSEEGKFVTVDTVKCLETL